MNDVVPGLGDVHWSLADRLAHAERIYHHHGPPHTPRRHVRDASPDEVNLDGVKRACRRCGEPWICPAAIWSAAVRAGRVAPTTKGPE